jgi:pimeloyl-ACP methyl ester carboxylesterase
MIRALTSLAVALGLAACGPAVHGAPGVAGGGQLHFESCGSGPQAVVLLHDGLLDASSFDGVWANLCRDFHVVRYDRRGYGMTPAATAPYSQTDDLRAVMAAAKLEHASLVGVSDGGGIALDYALDHPQSIDRLVLVGADISGFEHSAHFNKRNRRAFLPILIGDVGGVANNYADDPYLFAPDDQTGRDRARAIWKANPQDIAHLKGDPVRPEPSALPRMPGLKVPTLILVGDHDIPDVQAMAGAAQVLIPGSKRLLVEDSGHLVHLEHPDELAGLVRGFIRDGQR